jgi:hypothetical protein
MEYYDIYNKNNNIENLFLYSCNTTDTIKCKGDSLETESVKLVSPSNVTKETSWLPLKQINIRLTQGKSNISDDTAVPFLVNVWIAAVKKAAGKFSVKDDNTRNVMKIIFFYKI